MTFPTCFWWLEGRDGPKRGLLRLQSGAILRPKSGRIGFRIGLAGLEFPSRATADIDKLPWSFQEPFCTCFWWFEGPDGPKHGLRRLHRGAILRPQKGRIGCRIGLAGLEFPNRANADVAELPLSFQELFCTRFWWFEGRDGPKRALPRLQHGAISRPESGRIGCRIGLAGLEFLSRPYVDRC